MRTKIVTFFVFVWGAGALCLPVFAIAAFGLAPEGFSDGVCSQHLVSWLDLWRNEPGIRFTGIPDLCAARVLGSLTWLMGLVAIPIFLLPLGLQIKKGGRKLVLGIASQHAWSGRTVKNRLKSYAIVLFCIACSCYYVYWGYFSSRPIYLHSEAGAAAIVLGISFGPPLIILLSIGVAINVMLLISSRDQ